MPQKKPIAQPKGRPAFVGKLWQMVNDPENDPYIRWMPDGKSIQVVNREVFEKALLPKYFKHANFSSFVRQLNMYGWHKVQDLNSGSMHNGDENWQFQSPNFVRGHEELLDRIVRNKGTTKQENEDEDHDFHRILKELESIKTKQMVIGEDLFRIRKDNELLWNEYHQSREKYEQHSQLLDKILHFLASVYGQNGSKILDSMSGPVPGTKRRFITQMPDTPSDSSSGGGSGSGERIQEILEMKDLQDKIKESSGSVTPDAQSPDATTHGSALIPFNRHMAPMPHRHTAAGSQVQNQMPPPPASLQPHQQPQQPQQPQSSALATDDPMPDNDLAALQYLANNQDDIDSLADQLAMQDLSLQQVQDWISKMGPGEEAAVPAVDDANPETPVNFDVNDFLNSDMDEPVIKEEEPTVI